MKNSVTIWAAEWYSKNILDGVSRHLIYDPVGVPKLFTTRKEAREYIEQTHGYIKRRPDLRAEPFGWRLPRPIRVKISPVLKVSKSSNCIATA